MRVDMQVLQAHEAATKALKSYREAHGLSVERVEDTMDALSEVTRHYRVTVSRCTPLDPVEALLPVAASCILDRYGV